ncbi:MAG: DUF934 domain-containing protein [Gammaproteobacteria bacterium]|jgi:uncharacterized protein (DUF934 family)
MQIIRNRAVVSDHWRHLPDAAAVSVTGSDEGIIVSLPRWQRDRQALLTCGTDLGVRLSTADGLEPIAPDLGCFKVIALEFGVFTDGRGYSQARLLRQRYGYSGEIRARGDFLQDQVAFLERCGVNAFEIPADQNIGQTLKAFAEISITYQPAADTEELIFHRRRGAVANLEA